MVEAPKPKVLFCLGIALFPLSQLEASHPQLQSTAPGAGTLSRLHAWLPPASCSRSSGAMTLNPPQLASSAHGTTHYPWEDLPEWFHLAATCRNSSCLFATLPWEALVSVWLRYFIPTFPWIIRADRPNSSKETCKSLSYRLSSRKAQIVAGKKLFCTFIFHCKTFFGMVSVYFTCILNDAEPDLAAFTHSFILSSCLCKEECTGKTKI